jgi:hypothetical protein
MGKWVASCASRLLSATAAAVATNAAAAAATAGEFKTYAPAEVDTSAAWP